MEIFLYAGTELRFNIRHVANEGRQYFARTPHINISCTLLPTNVFSAGKNATFKRSLFPQPSFGARSQHDNSQSPRDAFSGAVCYQAPVRMPRCRCGFPIDVKPLYLAHRLTYTHTCASSRDVPRPVTHTYTGANAKGLPRRDPLSANFVTNLVNPGQLVRGSRLGGVACFSSPRSIIREVGLT